MEQKQYLGAKIKEFRKKRLGISAERLGQDAGASSLQADDPFMGVRSHGAHGRHNSAVTYLRNYVTMQLRNSANDPRTK